MATDSIPPSVYLRRAIVAQSPISLEAADGSVVSNLNDARKINLGNGQVFDHTPSAAPGSVPPTAHPSNIDLAVLVFAYNGRTLPISQYLQQSRTNGVAFVPLERRQNILEWLGGKGEEREVQQEENAEASLMEGNQPSSIAGPSTVANQQASGSGAVKRKYVVDQADIEAVKKIQAVEILLLNRSTPLRHSSLTLSSSIHNHASAEAAALASSKKDYSFLRKTVFGDKVKKMRTAFDAAAAGGGKGKAVEQASSSSGPAKKQKNSHPIIIVSSSPTALLTMWNIKRFLEDGIFESTKDAQERLNKEGVYKAEDVTVVIRKFGGVGKDDEKRMKYVVVQGNDALAKLGSRDDTWPRVVCVLTTGQAWQFKGYKWTDPKELFHHVKGIYFHWTNSPPAPSIKDWNVAALQVEPTKRHVDRALVAQFWRIIDNFRPS